MPEVRVTLSTPAAFGVGPSRSALVDTHWHVPGSVLRGGMAKAWIRDHGRPGDDPGRAERFMRLFEREVLFGPLFAPGSFPRPLSVWAHKYVPEDSCPQSEWDTSIEDLPPQRRCPACEQPLERAKGEIPPPALHESSHVELTAEGTAQDGALFTRLEISERQTFVGHVTGAWSDELAFDELWLGGGRSVRGLATVTVDPDGQRPLPEVRDGNTVVLRLLSPGIFVDGAGRPVQEPDLVELAARLGVDRAEVTRRWVRWTQIHGWHAASNLPKPMEHAVCAGSVFVVQCDRAPDPEGLRRLADEGVGLRRTEGYGVVGGRPPRRYTRNEVLIRCAPLLGMAVIEPAGARRSVIPAIEKAAGELRAGRRPANQLAQLADVIPTQWRQSLRFLSGLIDPDHLDAVAADMRKALRN